MTVTLAFIGLLVWWIGDRSTLGFSLSLLFSILATLWLQLMAYEGVLRYEDADFAGVNSWLPAVLFGGSVTCGSLGRLLARERAQEQSSNRPYERLQPWATYR